MDDGLSDTLAQILAIFPFNQLTDEEAADMLTILRISRMFTGNKDLLYW